MCLRIVKGCLVVNALPWYSLEEGNEPFVYRYDHERSTPYLYSVFLDDYGVEARFAPMKKAAIYSFAFEPGIPGHYSENKWPR